MAGFDEMDEVSGDGSAELFDDGTIEVEFAYRNGDEALLKASGRAICRAFRRRLAQTGPIEPAARARVRSIQSRSTSCAVWLWDARERVALAGRTASAFTPVLIADRKPPYIAADILGSRSWSAGKWKRTPARRSPSRPPEWP